MCPVARCRRGLRRDPSGSALPIIPQSVSRGARFSRLHWFAFATACQVARPLDGSDRVSPATGGFYIQASGGSVALPAAGYDYNSNWTPLLAGLSPAGMAASLAAPDQDGCARRLLPRLHGLPRNSGGSASATSLSRCYGADGGEMSPSSLEATRWSVPWHSSSTI